MGNITDPLVIPTRCAGDAFEPHRAFDHDPTGMGIVHIVARFDPVHPNPVKQKPDDRIQGLSHDPSMPPRPADAVADLPLLHPVIVLYHADGADWLSQLFEFDHSLVIIRLFVFRNP